jgi:two-component system sensor histidine kinase RegB
MTNALNQLQKWLFPLGSNLNENHLRASLIISLRWVIMVVEFLVALTYGFRNQLNWGNYAIVVVSIMTLVVFNTVITIRLKEKKKVSTLSLAVQLLFDLFQLFIFLKLIMSQSNPLVEIFYLPLIVGIITLPILWNFFFTIIIGILVGSFYLSSYADHHNYHHFYSHLFTISLLWGTLNLLMSFIRHFQTRLASVQNYKQRMDHLKVVGAMTSGFCHQMATPLNTIKLRLDRMNRNQDFSKDDLNSALMALGQCEQALRDLSQLKVERTVGINEDIDIKSFCENLIKNSYPELTLQIDEKIQTLSCHPQLLTQTLLDLFDNAFDSSEGRDIFLKIYQNDEYINFEVINHQASLSESVIDKLGEPFNSTKELGAGLGLFNAFNSALVMRGNFRIFNNNNNVHALLSLPLVMAEEV